MSLQDSLFGSLNRRHQICGKSNKLSLEGKTFLFASFLATVLFAFANPAQAQTPPTPAAPEAPAATEDASKSRNQEYKTGQNLFGFHAGVGFPQVIAYGVDYFPESRIWGLGLSLGGFGVKREKSGSDPDFKFNYGGLHVTGRYHPFHGVFYTGLHLGLHSAKVEATDTYLGQSATATGRLQGNYAAPHAGFLWITNWGITVSTELGAQLNFNGKTTIDDSTTDQTILNDATYRKNKKDAEDQGNAVFNGVLPYLTLLRVGYAF